ncbi:uncharacterized protein [Diadema antillarum]|uniref:uncharacterized protein n=1 Tax=Diadema antillarum TaxID=105358 RepID=UPI003A87104A
MEPINLEPEWKTQGPYDIHVCLKCCFQEDSAQDISGTNSLGRSPVILAPSSPESESCLLHVSCKPGGEVVSAAIISSARHVEIHSNTDGYLKTVRGEKILLEEELEYAIYMKEFILERPHRIFELKFVSLSDKGRLHLHHFQATLRKINRSRDNAGISSSGRGNIDMDHVRELLASQQPISEQAESLMNTVEQYQKNQGTVLQNLQEATIHSMTSQKSGAIDVGMIGQMASLLSTVSRTPSSGQTPPSPDAMLKLMSSLHQGGDAGSNEDMYNTLKSICRDVTNLRLPRRESESDQMNKNSQSDDHRERFSDDERRRETSSLEDSSFEERLQPMIAALAERISKRLEDRLEAMQTHMDLRLNKLETMLSELSLQKIAEVRMMEKEDKASCNDEKESNLQKYL